MISILVSLLRWIIRYQDLLNLVLLLVTVFLLGFWTAQIMELCR